MLAIGDEIAEICENGWLKILKKVGDGLFSQS